MHSDTAKIRTLNDRFRKGDPGVPGQILLTRGIVDLIDGSLSAQALLAGIIRGYDAFTTENDPHQEHDFGAFVFCDQKCFWKIDIYDTTLKMAPLDPTDTGLSRRVLTVMLAEEY